MSRLLHIGYYLLLVSLTGILVSPATTQWSTDPSNNLIVGYGQDPQLCSDGAGGCYITYTPELVAPYTIRVVRLNRFGLNAWGGYRIISGTDSLPSAWFAKIVEDGSGGVIVAYDAAYIQLPTIISRVRVHRIDSSGSFLWGPTGLRVTLSETNQGGGGIVADGSGGCIVVWGDTLGDLRINRIDATGTRAWGDSGKSVGNSSENVLLVEDNSGGCVVGVQGVTTNLFRRLSNNGNIIWSTILTESPTTKAISDGFGGVVTAGMKFISYNNGDPLWAAKAHRVDSVGQVLWGNNGLVLEDSIHGLFLNPPGVALTKNPDAGASIAWGRRRSPGVLELRTQTVRGDGSTIFGFRGRPVSRVSSSQGLVGVLLSDSASSLFAWGDSRNPGGMYGQRLDTTSAALWDTNDVALNFPEFVEMTVTTDGNGGCIGVGFHQFDFSIRALQVSKYGNLGQVISSVDMGSVAFFPDQPALFQNYPNPFNPQTTIRFQLPRTAPLTLILYNLVGQKVKALISGIQAPGSYSAVLEAEGLPSGTYFYRLSTPQATLTRKLIIIK